MTAQTILSLMSAGLGFVAAICFCIGSTIFNRTKTVELSKTNWGFSEEKAKAIVSQSTQYAVGALFLTASFGLQVAAILTNTTSNTESHLNQWQVVCLFLLATVLSVIVAFVFYKVVYRKRISLVLKTLSKSPKEDINP